MKLPLKMMVLFGSLAFISAITLAQSGGVLSAGAGPIGPIFPGSQIKGSPYCGTQETESTITLLDGTHITHKSKMRMCRDSQGRSRREFFSVNGRGEPSESPTTVQISDPIEGAQYSLDLVRKVAHRNVIGPPRPPLPPNPSPNASGGILPRNPPPVAMLPGPDSKPDIKTEHLDSRVVDGLLVEGIQNTVTYPAGMKGNDRPITTVEERWFSQELGETLLLRRSDPRSGETLQRLTDLDRSEPDPALFRVPADYMVEDTPNQLLR